MFPASVTGLDQADAYVWAWLESMGGQIVPPDAVVLTRRRDGALLVGPFELAFHTGLRVAVQMVVTPDLSVPQYRFHARTEAEPLIWRHDRHTGHEASDGGPTHLHVGDRRVPHAPVTLETVRDLIVVENLRCS
ncbi:hypothetical protein ER308_15155 [Egibacter rhizosphaerae]|uniref:Uncharacterized protein n=1 Tax=Egibacter rhizosphaerae TaxID=1670831 RepID=A0A411YI24_9ACTN|nr:hypothetical protein [Egibacter rhizosphaerae]QBI20769.1 hypothetical protein ER308_15155 [Egibacter rhizosphaerae]